MQRCACGWVCGSGGRMASNTPGNAVPYFDESGKGCQDKVVQKANPRHTHTSYWLSTSLPMHAAVLLLPAAQSLLAGPMVSSALPMTFLSSSAWNASGACSSGKRCDTCAGAPTTWSRAAMSSQSSYPRLDQQDISGGPAPIHAPLANPKQVDKFGKHIRACRQ